MQCLQNSSEEILGNSRLKLQYVFICNLLTGAAGNSDQRASND
jgi:hypothetical protein